MQGVSLDLGQKSTGIALWHGQELKATLHWEFGAEYMGQDLAQLEHSLTWLAREYELSWVAFEQASVVSYRHAQIQLAMIGIVHLVAHKEGLTIMPIHPSTAKKVLTGSGKAKKGDMVLAAKERYPGFDIHVDDIADAIAVGLAFFTKVELSPVQT